MIYMMNWVSISKKLKEMVKTRIRLNLAYDGTNFNGWQIQNDARTVQGEIQKALEKIHKQPTKIIGSGRTDSGVHARFQVAHFDTSVLSIPPAKYKMAINSYLPKDIRIIDSIQVEHDFHARFNAIERGYRYYILPQKGALPFNRDYCIETFKSHNLQLLNRYASYIVGEHDFSTFTSSGDVSKTKVRIITSASFTYEGEYLVFSISGNAFLWKMVRSIIGTILELEKQNSKPIEMKELLLQKNRKNVGTTAPARALFLDYVRYPNESGGTSFDYERRLV